MRTGRKWSCFRFGWSPLQPRQNPPRSVMPKHGHPLPRIFDDIPAVAPLPLSRRGFTREPVLFIVAEHARIEPVTVDRRGSAGIDFSLAHVPAGKPEFDRQHVQHMLELDAGTRLVKFTQPI